MVSVTGADPPAPTVPRAPVDTVTVHGGAGVSVVESDAVRRAATRLADAAADLRAAVACCAGAVGDLALPGVRPVTGHPLSGPLAQATAAAREAARGLTARAELCDLLAWRLLRAAGLYEEAESTAQRAVGGIVTAWSAGTGAGFGVLGAAGLAGLGVLGAAELGGRRLTAPFTGATAPLSSRMHAAVTRAVAPYTDEAFAGAGAGVALTRPALAGGRAGVPGGAAVLAHVAREAPLVGDATGGVALTRVDGFADGRLPDWSDTPAASVQEALARIDDLYPGTGGAPEATLAVQQVVGEGGATSWTVLVPGTQSALPADHPWDGRTDLELVAGQPDGATAAIEQALADAGVGPDEPVTLVGHSLGGIAATALVARPGFAERYRVGGLVTAGAPTGLLGTPPGVPVLHLETPEEVVSATDGRSGAENPRGRDRVTVVRSLTASTDPADRAASGSVPDAHAVATHVRTLDVALATGDPRVADVTGRIGRHLAGGTGGTGTTATTTYYRVTRAGP